MPPDPADEVTLRSAQPMDMPFFDSDIPCPGCGYNLRGLSLGRGCPECGLKIVSNTPPGGERRRAEVFDAEIEETLKQQEESAARQKRLDDLLTAWEQRGRRVDHVLDRLEQILRRRDAGE